MAVCLVFDCLCKRLCILLVHEEQKTIHKIKTSALWVNYGALWWSSAGLTGLAESQETEIFSHVESCVSTSSSVILLPVLNKSLLVQRATSQQGRGPVFSSEPPWLFYLNQLIFFCLFLRESERKEREAEHMGNFTRSLQQSSKLLAVHGFAFAILCNRYYFTLTGENLAIT